MTKFRFKPKKNPLSETELAQQMNFDRFLSARPKAAKPWLKTAKIFGTAGIAAAVITAGWFVFNGQANNEDTVRAPFIQPPVKALDIPSQTFIVNSESDTQLYSSTGSQVHIRNRSFAFAGGKAVTGPVEIRYREFHDPVDILLSGIPMNYDSAGKSWLLESAGMFELTAWQEGKPLELLPGKSITVNLVSHTPENNYNIYYLDTTNRRWEYIAENTRENQTCSEPLYVVNKEKEQLQEQNEPQEKEPVKPGKYNPKLMQVQLDYIASEFPELEAYKGLRFQLTPEETRFDLKLTEKTWEDVRLEESGQEGVLNLSFSMENASYSFRVTPVVPDADYSLAMQEYVKRKRWYDSYLAEKEKKQQSSRDSLYQLNGRYVNASNRTQLNDRFNAFITGNYTGVTRDMLVYRTLNVRRLGIWNSDRPWDFFDEFMVEVGKDKQKSYFSAHFSGKTGQTIMPKAAFLVKRGVNSSFAVEEKKINGGFPFKADMIDLVVVITSDQKIWFCREEDASQPQTKGSDIYFRMTAAGDDVNSISQLKSLLQI